MTRVAIIGFGALGRQILDLVSPAGPIVIFDDGWADRGEPDSYPVEGCLDAQFADCDYYVGFGYHHLDKKAELVNALLEAGRRVPSFAHPSSYVHPTSRLGEGAIVYPLCNVGADVFVGPGALLNNSVVASHESRIHESAYLSPAVVLSGRVTVEKAAFLGTGTLVSNGCRIGARARVGIGSVVTCDVASGASAIGNPLRILDRPLELE